MVPVLNKIDLPSADPAKVIKEIEEIIGIEAQDAVRVTAKTGENVTDCSRNWSGAFRRRRAIRTAPLQALIIDSWFDNYVGVVSLVRVVNGTLRAGEKIRVMSTGRSHQIDKLGRFTPKSVVCRALAAGEVGFVIAGIKEIDGAPVGDTITLEVAAGSEPLPGFKQVQPRVFAGVFPVNTEDYEHFRDALAKLRLNDSALHYEPEVSTALGFGFRIGFLGLLHMDIVQERLEREYNLELITSAPTVVYEVLTHRWRASCTWTIPRSCPPVDKIDDLREPIITANILVPPEYVGGVLQLCTEKRGVQKKMLYLGTQVSLQYQLPLAEVVLDFFDRLKSCSRGYASFDYEFSHFQSRAAGEARHPHQRRQGRCAGAHRAPRSAYQRGRELVDKMQELIPRQMFEVAVQATIGAHVIARATVKALRKNVLAKCYGGDLSRKRKLLEKQKEGKKRMKQVGSVEIPQEAFLAVLKVGRIWLALLLMILFGVQLGWLPISGLRSPNVGVPLLLAAAVGLLQPSHPADPGGDLRRPRRLLALHAAVDARGGPAGLHPVRAGQGALRARGDRQARAAQRAAADRDDPGTLAARPHRGQRHRGVDLRHSRHGTAHGPGGLRARLPGDDGQPRHRVHCSPWSPTSSPTSPTAWSIRASASPRAGAAGERVRCFWRAPAPQPARAGRRCRRRLRRRARAAGARHRADGPESVPT